MVSIVANNGTTRWEKPLSSTDSVSPAAFDGAQRSPVQIVLRKRIPSAGYEAAQ